MLFRSMKDHVYLQRVQEQIQSGQHLTIRSTPAFYVNGVYTDVSFNLQHFAALGTTDLMQLAGGGIIGHPHGIAGGVASMREGWEAAVAGVALEAYAQDHPALRAAIAKFGGDK